MDRKTVSVSVIALAALAIAIAVPQQTVLAQRGAGAGGGRGGARGFGGGARGGAPAAPLPDEPTAVALPDLSDEITGPGPMYDSGPAQWPGYDIAHFDYEVHEYFVSGTANDQPYTTRVVIRRPADDDDFSGLVVAESMHPAGNAHGFEYTSVYTMDSGHIAAEILTSGPAMFLDANAARYADLEMNGSQTNEILAQVGALIKSEKGPLAGLEVRKMVLFGTSASSQTLVNYLPAHMVYRTPDMEHIYDGFLPTSNGATIRAVDVPLIQIPTQHEYRSGATERADGDAPGDQYRNYEFAGMGHLDSRNNPRLLPEHCVNPLSRFPVEAYISVGLHHLFRWVDEGIVPPRADRIEMDGSTMALDDHGNAVGGIRNPYIDLATATYVAGNTATEAGASVGGPMGGPGLLCTLSVYVTPFSEDRVRELYDSREDYVREFEARLDALEEAGWSLPVYHDLLLADAKALDF